MVDSLNAPPAEEPLPAGTSPTTDPTRASFLSSTAGKLVMGGVALLLIVGAVVVILFLFVFNTESPDADLASTPAGSAGATSTASVEASPEVRPPDDFADTFAFRNVFQPTVKVTTTSTVDGDGTDSDVSESDVPADTLFLSSTSTVDGEPVATFIWNGSTYTLGEGESIPDSPWQVVSISGETVVMLYGDSRVTLTVGQGLSK